MGLCRAYNLMPRSNARDNVRAPCCRRPCGPRPGRSGPDLELERTGITGQRLRRLATARRTLPPFYWSCWQARRQCAKACIQKTAQRPLQKPDGAWRPQVADMPLLRMGVRLRHHCDHPRASFCPPPSPRTAPDPHSGNRQFQKSKSSPSADGELVKCSQESNFSPCSFSKVVAASSPSQAELQSIALPPRRARRSGSNGGRGGGTDGGVLNQAARSVRRPNDAFFLDTISAFLCLCQTFLRTPSKESSDILRR